MKRLQTNYINAFAKIAELEEIVKQQAARIAELERRLKKISSTARSHRQVMG